jgi:methylenetetrahydrofolate reductase (NADPH)
MAIGNLWQERTKPTISFEFYPARDEKAAQKLPETIDKLLELQPDFVAVTFGAGGSTRDGSYELVKKLKQEKKQLVLPYLAAYGLDPEDLLAIIDSYFALGVSDIFCVRGDQPKNLESFQPHPRALAHASDLLAFVRQRYACHLGAAGYPEGHFEAESKEKDLEYLKLKVTNGSQWIFCQFCLDNHIFFDFLDRCRDSGIKVPILAGIMPIHSLKLLESLAKFCGASIPASLRGELAKLPADDKQAVIDFGIAFAVEQCRLLLRHGVAGLHFFTMNRSQTVTAIVKQLRSEGLL